MMSSRQNFRNRDVSISLGVLFYNNLGSAILKKSLVSRWPKYFCAKKKVKEHVNACHKQLNPRNNSLEMQSSSFLHPHATIAREMCVVREIDDANWFDETNVDIEELSTVPTTTTEDAYLVVAMEESLVNLWSKDTLL
ncbi:uncharacterized protein LOC129226032 [Uloborus diversus]|uniref:uncharacterized protein LOC129226032 n=1 Tax=Uloborus diversus TaxID=327109 RepID=UPI00240A8DAC|nr:uncharacterized protein LOC129226032 [Uloborus diversus]